MRLPVMAKLPVVVALPLMVVEPTDTNPPLKVSRVVVALLMNGYPMVLVTVTAPAEPETEIPEPAARDVTKLVELAML